MNPISMNASRYTYLFVLTACCLFALTLKAQTVGVCSSNALAPVFKQDFGTGTSSSSSSAQAPAGSTNYTYSLANVGSDGYYALTPKFDNAGKPEWTKGGDHTSTVAGNPANGNMFLVNAGGSNSIFFQQDVNSLCPGSTYNFSAWLANANTPATVTQCGSSYVYAKVRFNIKNAADGTILQTYVTPDLPLSPNNGPANWIQYGFQFSVPSSVSQLRLEMVDERGGGAACGNDLAIDDIEFYACTPLATASINTPTSVCIGSTAIISSTLSNNPFLNPVYQWEKSTNGGSTWTAMGSPSTSATSLTITAVTLADAALYRVKVAPDIASLSSVYCTTASNAVTLSVSPLTVGGSVSSATVCSGTNSSVTLSGYTGSVVRWESSTDNGATWNNISNTTATQFYTAIATTQYRALVQSGVCAAEYATPGTVTVISSVPGTISSAATVCSGANSGTLTLGGYTGNILRWETSTNGGGTWTQVNNTTNTLSYSNLTTTTQYRALVRNGSCTQQYSPAVTITVIATVAGTLSSAATECSGSNGATLTLTGYSGSILRWESSTDGGNTWDVIANTSATYAYSNLTTTTRYRVVVQNASCATLTSNVVIITVNTINGGAISPAATTVCSGSNSGTLTLSGYDGAIVRWERSTNNGVSWSSIGGTANDVTYSYSNLTVTTSYRAVIRKAPCPDEYSAVAVVTPASTSAGTLGTAATVCAGNNTGTLNLTGYTGSIVRWESAANAAGPWTTISNTSDNHTYNNISASTYYRAVVKLGSCASANSNSVLITTTAPPTTSNAGPDQSLCNVTSATLAGNTPSSGTGTWTQVSGPTTVSFVNAAAGNTVVNGLTTGSYQFRWTIANSPCASSSSVVNVTVAALPTTSDAGTDQALCNTTTTTLAGINPAVGTGTWTRVSGPNTPLFNASQYNTTVTGLTAGTYQFRWTIANGSCVSSASVVNINVDPATVPGTLASANTVCAASNSGTINLTGYTGAIVRWESSTDNGNTWNSIVNTTAAYTYTNLNTTTQFRAFVKSGVCAEAASNIVTITVMQPVTIANAGTNQALCNVTAATLAANNPTIGTGAWTQVSGPTAASFNNAAQYNTTVSGLTAGTYQFRWTISNSPCASSSSVVNISIDPATLPGTLSSDNTVCRGSNNGTISLAGYTGSVVRWESSTDNGNTWNTIVNTTAAYTYSNLTTTTQFRAFVKSGVCAEAASNIVTITVDPVTVPGTLSSNNTVCATSNNGIINLSGYTGSIVRWESSTDNGNTWNTIVNTTAAYTYSNLNTTTQFRAFVKSGVCAEAASNIITITVDPITVPGTLTSNNTVCATSNNGTINLSGYTGTIVRWESSTDNGNTWNTIVNTTAAYTYSNLNTTTQFRAFVKSGVCSEAASNIVTITVMQAVTPANAGTAQVLCNTTTTALAANNPVVGTGAWTQVSGPTAASVNNAAQYNTTVSGLTAGTYQFRWTISNSPCASSNDVVTVSIDPATVPGTLSSNNTVCATSNNGTINLTGYTGSIVRWESSTDNGNTWNTIVNTTAAYTYSNLNTTTQFRAFVKSGVCSEAASNIVTITVMQAVTPANAGTAQVLCNTTTTTLAANNPAVGTGAWTQVSGPTTASFNNAAQYNTTVSGLTTGTYQFRWTISNSPCASSNDVVTVSIDPATVPGTLSSNNTVCATSNNGTINLTGYTGSIVRWESSTDNGNTWNIIANTTDAYTYSNLTTTTQFRGFVKSGVCAEAASNIVTITVDPATVPGTLSSDNTICATSNNGTINLTGYTGSIVRWESSTDNGNTWNTIANTTAVYTYNNLNTTTQFRAFVKSGVCSEAASNIVTISVDPVTAPGTLSSNNTVCATSNNGTINLTGYTGTIVRWESSTDNGSNWNTIVNTTDAYTYNNLNTTTQFRAFVKSGVCTEATSNIVTITVDPVTVPGTLSSNNTVCATSNNGTINLTGYTGSIARWESSTDNGTTWNTIANTTAAYTYSNLNATTQFRAFVKSGVCSEAASNIITITVMQPVTAANAGTAQVLCNTTTATLAANNPAVGTGAWTQVSGPTTASFNNAAQYNTIVSGLTTGTYQFRWTISNSPCASSNDVVTVSIDPATVPGTLSSNNTVCATSNNGTINLTGYTGTIARWESSTDNGNTWNTIANTTAAHTYNNLNTTTQFRAFVKSGVCAEAASNIVTITVDPVTVPGTLSSNNTVCATSNNGTINLSGYTGSIVRWESSTDNGNTWNTIANTTAAYTYSNLTTTTQFRAFVKSGVCSEAASNIVTITVDPVTVPGTLSSNNTVCATSNNGTINLSGYTGSIVRWESSTDNGNTWNIIANTTDAYTYNNLNTTTQFRAFVKSGICAEAASNIVTVTVDPVTVPGTLSSNNTVCATSNNGTINLTGYTGTIVRWESSTDNGTTWNTIANTTAAYTYSNLNATTQFRAFVKSGVCSEAVSNIITITVMQPVTAANAGTAQVLCNTTTATLAANNPAVGTGAWTQVSGPTTASFNNAAQYNTTVSGLTAGTYQFRWTISNSPCASSNDVVTVSIDPATVPGTLTSDNTVCASSNNGTINLTGYTGSIVRWESSTDNGSTWNTIANTTAAYTYNNLNTTTQFRAFVKSGVCAEAASNILTITVDPVTVPGTLSSNNTVCATANNGTINLTGYTG
ncbi:PKD domain-containing protein, partial [Sediminibacterium ginsengisoli]